jgi:hypothetical protein
VPIHCQVHRWSPSSPPPSSSEWRSNLWRCNRGKGTRRRSGQSPLSRTAARSSSQTPTSWRSNSASWPNSLADQVTALHYSMSTPHSRQRSRSVPTIPSKSQFCQLTRALNWLGKRFPSAHRGSESKRPYRFSAASCFVASLSVRSRIGLRVCSRLAT